MNQVLVPITMKNAANCDTQCELQDPASHQIFERNLRWRKNQHVCFRTNSVCCPRLLDSEGSEGVPGNSSHIDRSGSTIADEVHPRRGYC
jgi:hypothetical protein